MGHPTATRAECVYHNPCERCGFRGNAGPEDNQLLGEAAARSHDVMLASGLEFGYSVHSRLKAAIDVPSTAGGSSMLSIPKRSPLLVTATLSGDADIVRLLLDRGSYTELEHPGLPGATPLFLAARDGYVPIIAALIEAGAQLDPRTRGAGVFTETLAAQSLLGGGDSGAAELLSTHPGDSALMAAIDARRERLRQKRALSPERCES